VLITTSRGIYFYDHESESIKPHRQINELLREQNHLYIKRVFLEDEENFWLADSNGVLLKVGISDDKATLLQSSELLRGKLITDFEHLNPMPQRVLVGTLDGFALYNSDNNDSIRSPLRALISKVETPDHVLLDGSYESETVSPGVSYSQNALKFTFTSSSYEDLVTNQYQYYLEGSSQHPRWSPFSFVPFKEYTNLREGEYKLHVRTSNFENRVSPENVIAFVILPPWYRSWWARCVYGITFIAASYFFYKRIQHRIANERKRVTREEQHQLWLHQKEWEEIDLENKKQMMALEGEKLTIEQLALREREILLEKEKEHGRQVMALEKEKLEADIRHKNNELSSLTLHITQKNEMINKIANQLSRTIQESAEETTLKNLKDIRSSLQKALDSNLEWEKFTDHFDIVHDGFLKKLQTQFPELSSSTLKLCAFLKMRLSSKQIASLMNTAPDSVLKARYRLRVKFNLDKETNLEEFLNSL
jgi:hypothetical protein